MMSGLGITLQDAIGGITASATTSIEAGALTQSFSTQSVVNTQTALYTLSIRDSSPPSPAVLSYTFPLSPSSLKRKSTSMANVFDTSGPPQTQGVTRTVDMYGQAPPIFMIDGTTGWKLHSTDGMQLTGIQSIAAVQSLLEQFAAYNRQQQISGNSSPYTMEFYDYFYNDFWQVVPVGEQLVQQDEKQPLLFYYSFRLAGIQRVSSPTTVLTPDLILNTLTQSITEAATSLLSGITNVIDDYPPTAAIANDLGSLL